MKPRVIVPLAAICVALAAAGCGSSKKSTSTPPSTPAGQSSTGATTTQPSSGGTAAGAALKLSADPSGQLRFDKTSLTAKAGKVTLDMANPSAVMHAIGVKGSGLDKKGASVGQGANSTVTVTLKPGTYTFYCPVDQHEAAGMKGTLTVK